MPAVSERAHRRPREFRHQYSHAQANEHAHDNSPGSPGRPRRTIPTTQPDTHSDRPPDFNALAYTHFDGDADGFAVTQRNADWPLLTADAR